MNDLVSTPGTAAVQLTTAGDGCMEEQGGFDGTDGGERWPAAMATCNGETVEWEEHAFGCANLEKVYSTEGWEEKTKIGGIVWAGRPGCLGSPFPRKWSRKMYRKAWTTERLEENPEIMVIARYLKRNKWTTKSVAWELKRIWSGERARCSKWCSVNKEECHARELEEIAKAPSQIAKFIQKLDRALEQCGETDEAEECRHCCPEEKGGDEQGKGEDTVCASTQEELSEVIAEFIEENAEEISQMVMEKGEAKVIQWIEEAFGVVADKGGDGAEEDLWDELEAIFGSLEEAGRPAGGEGGVPVEGASFPSQE